MTDNNQTVAYIESLLLANKRVLNVPELSQLTGLSKSWIYKLCQQRKIPHSKPNGKLIMFDREVVQNWLLSNPVRPGDDIEAEAINYIVNNPIEGGEQMNPEALFKPNLDALYQFKLPHAWLTPMFLLQPLGKTGNNKVFNDFFTTPDLISCKDVGPIAAIADNYQAKELSFLNTEGKRRKIVFQRNQELLGDNGIVKVLDYHHDCYLYSVVAPNTIEVYISNGNSKIASHLLMMLCDGLLEAEILVLRNRIFN